MPDSVLDMLREVNPDAVPADSPPEGSNYRSADVQGITCAHCSKFTFTGEMQDENGEFIPTGYCDQWEANVRGDFVSDGFADTGPALDEDGNEVWDFADEKRTFAEIHLSGTDQTEEDGYVIKEILRTGEWPLIPTAAGIVNKPLRIIRDGKSNPADGTIALSEVVENFKSGVIQNVQIPLSDDAKNEHKNNTRVNTGFVRDIWIVDDGDTSKLVAKMEFTEPEIKEKVLRGTYADVSCGIPWKVRSRGETFGATLEHVAITNKPFIDGLGPFLAMSDKNAEEMEIAHFGEQGEHDEGEHNEGEREEEEQEITLSFSEIVSKLNRAFVDQLNLSANYVVTDIKGDTATIKNKIVDTTWTAQFTIDGEEVSLAAPEKWAVEDEGKNDEPPAQMSGSPRSSDHELDQARCLRELRLSGHPTTKRAKEGTKMPALTREELDRLELSDEARAALQQTLDENATLRASARENEVDRRVEEISEMGLKERPGALKLYRQVMLSDDGGPAVVLLSDNGQEKERLTAIEVLDKFIEGIVGSDGKVTLSDQHLESGNDTKPPETPEGETRPVEERAQETREFLYGKK